MELKQRIANPEKSILQSQIPQSNNYSIKQPSLAVYRTALRFPLIAADRFRIGCSDS
jgi:hypothetical protein